MPWQDRWTCSACSLLRTGLQARTYWTHGKSITWARELKVSQTLRTRSSESNNLAINYTAEKPIWKRFLTKTLRYLASNFKRRWPTSVAIQKSGWLKLLPRSNCWKIHLVLTLNWSALQSSSGRSYRACQNSLTRGAQSKLMATMTLKSLRTSEAILWFNRRHHHAPKRAHNPWSAHWHPNGLEMH